MNQQIYRDSSWRSTCEGIRSYASNRAIGTTQAIQQLMDAVAEKVCNQPSPQSDDELNKRFLQRSAASSIIAQLSHGDSAAQGRPSAYAEILVESRRLADFDILGSEDLNEVYNHTLAYSAKIGGILNTHSALLP